jgi:hypothetical protein
MEVKKALPQVERVLAVHAADTQLRTLVDGGCSRSELIGLLDLAFLADESWKSLVGMNLRKLRATIRQIKDCAASIDRLNRSDLIHRVSLEYRDIRFASVHESPTLADRLRDYANLIESLRQDYGPKRRVSMNAWKAWIVAIVTEDTRKNYDREVSSLIAAVLDNPKYSDKAHQAWRLKHGHAVEMMRGKLRQSRARIAARITPPNPIE